MEQFRQALDELVETEADVAEWISRGRGPDEPVLPSVAVAFAQRACSTAARGVEDPERPITLWLEAVGSEQAVEEFVGHGPASLTVAWHALPRFAADQRTAVTFHGRTSALKRVAWLIQTELDAQVQRRTQVAVDEVP